MPGGIAHEAFREDTGLLRQVRMLHCVQCDSVKGTFLSWGRLTLQIEINLLNIFINKPKLGGSLFLMLNVSYNTESMQVFINIQNVGVQLSAW